VFYGLLSFELLNTRPKTFDKALQGTEIYRPFGCFTIALFINSATRNNAMQVQMQTQLLSQVCKTASSFLNFFGFAKLLQRFHVASNKVS
jgi:hypothetical protein